MKNSKSIFKIWALVLALFWIFNGIAQELPHYPDSLFSAYYHQRVSQFKNLSQTEGEITFLGNSITDGGAWDELFPDSKVINRGISGDITTGVLNRLDDVVDRKPKKVFILIGTNDLSRGVEKDVVLNKISKIVSLIHEHTPSTKVYIQSIFPVNKKPGNFLSHAKNSGKIKYINSKLKKNAEREKYTFVDVYGVLKNENDEMNLNYSNDGLHLLGSGYMAWKHSVFPYVYDLNEKPAIIPEPQELNWKENSKEVFPLYRLKKIVVQDDALEKEAQLLQEMLREKGIVTEITNSNEENEPQITLRTGELKNIPHHKEEGYTLEVNEKSVEIVGGSDHGVFNCIQTLRRLIPDGAFINKVSIKDWPSFSWRGYIYG